MEIKQTEDLRKSNKSLNLSSKGASKRRRKNVKNTAEQNEVFVQLMYQNVNENRSPEKVELSINDD